MTKRRSLVRKLKARSLEFMRLKEAGHKPNSSYSSYGHKLEAGHETNSHSKHTDWRAKYGSRINKHLRFSNSCNKTGTRTKGDKRNGS